MASCLKAGVHACACAHHRRLAAEVEEVTDVTDYSVENFAYGSTPFTTFARVSATQAARSRVKLRSEMPLRPSAGLS